MAPKPKKKEREVIKLGDIFNLRSTLPNGLRFWSLNSRKLEIIGWKGVSMERFIIVEYKKLTIDKNGKIIC